MMATDRYQRPELGTVAVGDTVIVYPTGMNQRNSRDVPIRCTVAKSAKVWIDVVREDGGFLPHYDSRFRKDTQSNASDTTSGRARFVTEAQYAWDMRRDAVRGYLREAGITVEDRVRGLKFGDPSTPGRWYGREVELANLLRAAEGLDPL